MNYTISRYLLPRLQDMFFLAIFLGVLVLGGRMLNMDGDLPRHILVGQIIAEQRAIPASEPIAYPYAGESYVSHEWLADLLLYGVYAAAGLPGIVILSGLLLAGAFTLLFREAVLRTGSRLPVLLLFLLGAGVTSIHWITRPHLFSMLMLAGWLILSDRLARGERIPVWALPGLMLIWSNLHGEFIAGILVLFAYAVGWTWEALTDRQSVTPAVGWGLWRALLLSLLACLITPSGLDSWGSMLGFVSNSYMMARMSESNAPDFHLAGMRPLLLLIGLSIALLASARQKVTPGQGFLLAGFTMMTLIAARNVHLYGMVAPFVLVETLGRPAWPRLLTRLENTLRTVEGRLRGSLLAPLLVLALSVLVLTSRAGSALYAFSPSFFPVDAVAWLRQNPQSGPMFNDLNWGGYIGLALWPEGRPFIDSVVDGTVKAATQGTLTRQYEAAVTLAGWQEVFSRHDIRWALLPRQSALAGALEADGGWVTQYQDDTAVVLAAP